MKKIHPDKELVGTWGWFYFLEWNSWLRKLEQPFAKSGWPYVEAEKEEQNEMHGSL